MLTNIVNENKTYEATLLLGAETDTLDSEGKIVRSKSIPKFNDATISEILKSFLGTYYQKPPMFSAKKVNGVRLYKLARKNIEIDRKLQNCSIFEISLMSASNNSIEFSVTCSKGTYIRVLGSDIAEKIGTIGYLIKLVRTGIGDYKISDSLSIHKFESQWKSLEN